MSALAKLTSSRCCYYKTARETLAWLLGNFCFIALTLRDLLSLGIKTVTRATLPAQQPKCLKCAFISLSLWLAHSGQSHSLIFKGNFSTTWPQLQRRLELGKYSSTFIYAGFALVNGSTELTQTYLWNCIKFVVSLGVSAIYHWL